MSHPSCLTSFLHPCRSPERPAQPRLERVWRSRRDRSTWPVLHRLWPL